MRINEMYNELISRLDKRYGSGFYQVVSKSENFREIEYDKFYDIISKYDMENYRGDGNYGYCNIKLGEIRTSDDFKVIQICAIQDLLKEEDDFEEVLTVEEQELVKRFFELDWELEEIE